MRPGVVRAEPVPSRVAVQVVTITVPELRALLRELVRDELAELVEDMSTAETGPRLLTRAQCVRQLGWSLATIQSENTPGA